MLHHEDPEVAVLHEADEELGELGALGGVEPRRRLVEQQQVRPPGQGPGQLDEAALAGGDLRRQPVVDQAEAGLVDELRLIVYPLMAGEGPTLFEPGLDAKLKLVSSTPFASGAVGLVYEKAE